MKKTGKIWMITASLLFSGYATSASPARGPALEIRAMTFNIRYGLANDGENRWELRKEVAFDVIRDYAPEVLGLQEALRFQLDDFNTRLPEYSVVGTGSDGGSNGAHSPILYLRKRFDADESGTFWLSDTPAIPSAHWGNRHKRVCTWVRLIDKKTRQAFYVYNTHLDHESQQARENGAQLIMKTIQKRKHPDPFVLMGDLNAAEHNVVIAYLKGNQKLADMTPIPLLDSWRVLYPTKSIVGTTSGFTGKTDGPKIDYILVTPNTRVLKAAILRTSRNGRYPSDHYPVTARLSLNF